MMRRGQGRSTVACLACHKQKLKCTGDIPCQRCKNRGSHCTYPTKDRMVLVSDSYLKQLERDAAALRRAATVAAAAAAAETAGTAGIVGTARTAGASNTESPEHPLASGRTPLERQMVDDCSAENFVQKLREMSLGDPHDQELPAAGASSSKPAPPSVSANYTYSRLKFDFFKPEISFRLPPRPYAMHLLEAFEEGFRDYHWMLRKKFRERLFLTYSDPRSQASDRIWLCKVSVVMALAETWISGRSQYHAARAAQPVQPTSPQTSTHIPNMPTISLFSERQPQWPSPPAPQDADDPHDDDLPPGAELFEQGLFLLRSPLEEARIEDVEALNLIAFYCYSLNRRRTAYLMSGQSVRMATLLRLHEPWPGQPRPREADAGASSAPLTPQTEQERIEAEHRKRVWWTSYCMDRMVSTEFGFPPVLDSLSETLPLPSNASLASSPAALAEFFDPQILTAQIQLCQIKTAIVQSVMQKVSSPETLAPCMRRLHDWHRDLPPNIAYEFGAGMPAELWASPSSRVLLSLYLRYYQCMILLVRPLLLQELSALFQQRGDPASTPAPFAASQTYVAMKIECLYAAQCNCRILDDLWSQGKIAKFGYWDSLHLFSGLAILCLARILKPPPPAPARLSTAAVHDRSTFTFAEPAGAEASTQAAADTQAQAIHLSEPDREQLYTRARSLLEEMARVGNPAAKDHLAMLGDVEDTVAHILHPTVSGPRDGSSSFLPGSSTHSFYGSISSDRQERNETSDGHASHAAHDGHDPSKTFVSDHTTPAIHTGTVPFFNLTDLSFGGLQEEQAWQGMDWDDMIGNWSVSN